MLCKEGPDLSDVVQCKPARSSSFCNVVFESQLVIENYSKISDYFRLFLTVIRVVTVRGRPICVFQGRYRLLQIK